MSYQVHESATESLNWVSSFISQRQQIRFNGSWMLVAEWRNVPQYNGDTSIVIISIIMSVDNKVKSSTVSIIRPTLIKQSLLLMNNHHLHCLPTTVSKWNGPVMLELV